MAARNLTHTTISRRDALLALLGLGLVATSGACATEAPSRPLELPRQRPGDDSPDAPAYADALDALADVLLPAERNTKGAVVVPGAREAKVDRVLDAGRFAPLAVALGFVPTLPAAVNAGLASSGEAFRTAMNAELDALASLERPLTPFADLPAETREKIVARALDDELLAPSILVVRAACMAAHLGAIASDVGMVATGMPAYEDHADGLACSGYPRRKSDGSLVDPEASDLASLERSGDLDDYTYNRAPAPTPGDDLSLVLDENGDLR